MKKWFAVLLVAISAHGAQQDRPNILWIVSEDNSPMLGCYGDPDAMTPNLDKLAERGVRYTRAFANSPVCSSARSTLVMGMHPVTTGMINHRRRIDIPEWLEAYPVAMRKAGYYCTNNEKTDYNFTRSHTAEWDERGNNAHYRNRPKDKPFFAVFNTGITHEGQFFPNAKMPERNKPSRDPKSFTLPPYYPDISEVRHDYAIYHDRITEMDAWVGGLLKQLEKEGLADDTIVFYYSDHGGALIRGKRSIRDSGTRVPLIVYFPEKWEHLAPASPGSTCDRLVSFVDFSATILSLAGVKAPSSMQGVPFLGKSAGSEKEFVFLYRNRMDERFDMMRAVRDNRYRYVRHYTPHRPYGQPYAYPANSNMHRAWRNAWLAGECNAVQSQYWEPKSPEAFYDTQVDPHEVDNLIDDPRQAERISNLQKKLEGAMLDARDMGFIPESMMSSLIGNKTLYEYAQSQAYPLGRIKAMADMATSRDPAFLPQLKMGLGDKNPVVRYWAAMGCTVLGESAMEAMPDLKKTLDDAEISVRIAAAEALAHLGHMEWAAPVFREALVSRDGDVLLEVVNALEFLGEAAYIFTPELVDAMQDASNRKNAFQHILNKKCNTAVY